MSDAFPLPARPEDIIPSLVKRFDRQPAGTPTPDGRPVSGTWSRVRFDIVLAPTDA